MIRAAIFVGNALISGFMKEPAKLILLEEDRCAAAYVCHRPGHTFPCTGAPFKI